MAKIFLKRTVVYSGRHYLSDMEHDFPKKIADEIINKNAGEPVYDLKSGMESDPGMESDIETDPGNQNTSPALPSDVMEDYIIAAEQAIDAGLITASGAPEVRAMEKILGCNISSADRDAAWAALKIFNNNSGSGDN